MKNYYPVNFDNLDTIQQQVLSFLPENCRYKKNLFYIDDNVNKFLSIRQLKDNIDKLGILNYISSIGFYVIPTTNELGTMVHIDHSKGTYSLNLPIMGCNNTWVKFYDSDVEPILKYNNAGVPYYHCDRNTCKEIDKFEMLMPYVIDVKKIHNVVNTNKETRITLLIRLKDPWTPDMLFQSN